MSVLAAAEIPTLRLLYKLKKLDPPPTTLTPLKGATAAYNNKIATIQGDITKLDVDAIVNAANRSLLGGGGVDGAIHRAAGPGLQDECRILGGCATGTSKITDAYELPCRKVIHTVGPVYNERYGDRCAVALRGCYQSSLLLAAQYGLKTIAFSAISTGVYGYPSLEAAKIACATARDFLSTEFGKKMDKIIFVTFEEKDVRAYNFILPRFFPPSREEAQSIDSEAAVAELPSVPKTDPSDSEHVQKKQKQNGNTI